MGFEDYVQCQVPRHVLELDRHGSWLDPGIEDQIEIGELGERAEDFRQRRGAQAEADRESPPLSLALRTLAAFDEAVGTKGDSARVPVSSVAGLLRGERGGGEAEDSKDGRQRM
jgi:hypothetical protein